MEDNKRARKEGDGDTPGTPQEKVEMTQPEDGQTFEKLLDKQFKMTGDRSHVSPREQILQLMMEIIYFLTGEDYMVVKKTSDDPGTSNILSIEELDPPTLKNDKKVMEVINKIMELLASEVGDASENVSQDGDGNRSSLHCSEVRSLTPSPNLEASECFVTQPIKMVDKERLSVECKSQNNTTEEASNGDCGMNLPAGEDLNTYHIGGHGATKRLQTANSSTYILVYSTSTLNNETLTKVNTPVKVPELSRRTTHKNPLKPPEPLNCSPNKQQIDGPKEQTCTECGKVFNCRSHLTKHQRMHRKNLDDSLKPSKTFSVVADPEEHQADQLEKISWVDYNKNCESHLPRLQRPHMSYDSSDSINTFGCTSDFMECEVEIRDLKTGNCDSDEQHDENLEGCYDLGGDQIVNPDTACHDCGKNFSYKSHLARHQKIHGERLFLCSECGKRFSLKSALLRHQMIHTGEKPYACTICGKCFNQRSHYVRHQLSHSGKKPFACSDCGKNFIQKSDLVKHQNGHKGKKLSCPVCRKEFCSKTFLMKHLKSHGESNRAICSECGKCFSQKSALVVHQKIHTGEKPFSCDHCGKVFNRKSLLVRHQRIHTGEKPFSCRECGKCFTRTTNLIIHQRTHSGEKPYSCSKCSKSFNSNGTLVKHQKTHGEDLQVL